MKKVFLTMTLLAAGAAFAQTTDTTTQTTPATTTPTTQITQPVTPAPATTAPAASTGPAASPDPATVVATVGSERITLGEFNRDFRAAVGRVVNQQGAPLTDEIMQEFGGARADYLKQYVRDRALYQVARASVKADAAAVDKQFAATRANFQSDAEFAGALAQAGYASLEDYRASLERSGIVNTYLDSVKGKFRFSDTLVSGYYNLHKSQFTSDAQACARHILVKTKEEADAIVKDLAGGKDFAAVAKEKSLDPGSAAQGGDLGCFGQGEMVESFDKASFSGPLNQNQEVQSEYGWHIVNVTKRTAAGLRPLTEVADQIRDLLSRDAAQKYLDAQIARLKTETFPDTVQKPETK